MVTVGLGVAVGKGRGVLCGRKRVQDKGWWLPLPTRLACLVRAAGWYSAPDAVHGCTWLAWARAQACTPTLHAGARFTANAAYSSNDLPRPGEYTDSIVPLQVCVCVCLLGRGRVT